MRVRRRKEKCKETLDTLSGIFAELYVKDLLKLPKDAKVVDGSSRLEAEIASLRYSFERSSKYSPAYLFARGLWLLMRTNDGQPTSESYAFEPVIDWVRAVDAFVKKGSKSNERYMDEKFAQIPFIWRTVLQRVI
jgi:hypothetical protein